MEIEPWLDFSSGYVQRALKILPKQGAKTPWKVHQNYALDLVALRYGKVDDGTMEFSKAKARPRPRSRPRAFSDQSASYPAAAK
jgi:monooxygenase